jgi:glutathione S-transferase
LVDALYRLTSPEAVLVTEVGATAKYLNELYGERSLIGRDRLTREELARLRADRAVQLVFLDRNDSEYWRATARENAKYTAEVGALCDLEPLVDLRAHNEDRLRIWNVRACPR